MVVVLGTRCSELSSGAMDPEAWSTVNELRAKNVLCDAVLRTEDGGSFPVHRTVLLIHSDFFRFVLFTNVLY
jgi:kelch-like protein 10